MMGCHATICVVLVAPIVFVAWHIKNRRLENTRVSFFNVFGLPSRAHGGTKRGNSLTKIAHPEMIHRSKSDKLVI